MTESAWTIGSFDGFYLPKRAQGGAAQPRPRQIEFIGDLGMTGYGIRSASRTFTQDKVRLLSDTQIGYPALLAKALDADYQLNAISGRGMIGNYGGTNAQDDKIYAYPSILPDVGAGVDDLSQHRKTEVRNPEKPQSFSFQISSPCICLAAARPSLSEISVNKRLKPANTAAFKTLPSLSSENEI